MSIFDLLGLCARISKNSEYDACARYYGSQDAWTISIHKGTTAAIIYTCQIVESDPNPMFNDKTAEQAYSELKEYLP